MRRRATCYLLSVAVLLGACSLAPDYETPQTAPSLQAFKDYGVWEKAAPADDLPRGAWWKVFGDPALDSLENKIQTSNESLKAAVARYQEAAALAGVARAAYFPTLTLNSSSQRVRQSDNGPLFKEGSTPKLYNDDAIGLGLSYEIDVWGRVRNAVAEANANLEASAADLETLDLMQHAELASDYFALRGDDEQQTLLDDTVAAYQKALDLTERRYAGKIASEIDVDQAKTQLETARTQDADTTLKRGQLEHAIAVLVGENASGFSIPSGNLPKTAPVIDPGMPSRLLERRPDVAAAERRVFAANAGIGVARAAYFPTFSLGGVFGLEGKTLGDWLTAPSQMWSLGPSASMTLFDGGAISSLSDQARAQYDEAAANYRQATLAAFQDAEDALLAQHQYDQEFASESAAAAAAQRALDQANLQYKAGIVDYLQVVSAQSAALAAHEAAVTAAAQRLGASVLVVRAIGGGWSRTDLDAPPEVKNEAPAGQGMTAEDKP